MPLCQLICTISSSTGRLTTVPILTPDPALRVGGNVLL